MPSNTICKTIHQYNKRPVSDADLKKLQEIADDCGRVKNYVYDRFGGVGALPKLYPGYTIQNEMTKSGLREALGLPSVYFYLAVFDALRDIKCQWTRTKSKIGKLIGQNDRFTEEEKHYLRFLLKVHPAFSAVLNKSPVKMSQEIQTQYDRLAEQVDAAKLDRYLCRQVRKYCVRQHTGRQEGFSIAERAYRYADHGIYISVKEKRKRIFIPLTDNNQYGSQLYIKLIPEENRIEIKVPVNVSVRQYAEYTNRIGISLGMRTMVTTDNGHRYGDKFGEYEREYTDWIRRQTKAYCRSKKDNPGRKKYEAKKRRLEERIHSYVNHELNRFFRTEMPQTIYIVKLPRPKAGGFDKTINYSVNMWQRGYIRSRLTQKCAERSVELVKVLGKNIGRECSQCGGTGIKKDGVFFCAACGCELDEKTNSARNVLQRGTDGKIVFS